MVKITILNETGHTELTLSATEALDQIIDHPTHWAYVDGELVSREDKIIFHSIVVSPAT